MERTTWIKNACRDITADNGGSLRTLAETCARRCYDVRALKIDVVADKIRRALYKLSFLKEFLERLGGAGLNSLERAHRNRLCDQTFEDYCKMLVEGDYPPALNVC